MDEDMPLETLVLRYLDEEMSPEEREMFEKNLNTDPELSGQLEKFRLAKEAVKYYGIHQQVSEVRKIWEAANAAKETPVRAKLIPMRRFVRYALVAASMLFIFIIIKALFLNSAGSEKIYRDTYIGYQLSTVRSQAIGLSKLEKAYQEKKYAEVITLSKQTSLTPKDQLLSGISYLQINNPKSAIGTLEPLLAASDLTYHQDAEFYLALAYLKNKDYKKALPLMIKINKDPGHLYHNQVNEKTIKELEHLH